MNLGGVMFRTRRLVSLGLLVVFFSGISATVFAQDDDTVPDVDIRSAINIGDLGSTVPGPTSPTGTKRPPRVGPNVLANTSQAVNPGLLGRSETTIASSADGSLILIGFNDAQGFCGRPFGVSCTPETPPGLSGFAFSTDSGLTFTDGGAPDPALFNNVFTRGDPWIGRGGFDNTTFYYANLAVDATTSAGLGVSVHRGHFNTTGFAFEDVHTFNAPNPSDFYDKEAIVTSQDGSGAAYVSLTNFISTSPCGVNGGFGQIEVWRTQDAGDTWIGPTIVSPDQTDVPCDGGGVLQQSSAPAIGPNAEVYVAWQLGPHLGPTLPSAKIMVARSLDGGVTFGSVVKVADINSMRLDPPVGYNRSRINDHPRIAVATSGTHKGRVYVTFYGAVSPVSPAPVVPCPTGLPAGAACIGQNLVSTQPFVSFSDDKGQTWSVPVPVASAPGSSGLKRWWPVVNVEPTGNLDVVYYESQETATDAAGNPLPQCIKRLSRTPLVFRVGPANSLVNTIWVQSLDGGLTFPTRLQMSTATSNWCPTVSNVTPNFGDYIGATAGGNRILSTWADGRNGVPDTFFAAGLGSGK
jgi:hypothetical protein